MCTPVVKQMCCNQMSQDLDVCTSGQRNLRAKCVHSLCSGELKLPGELYVEHQVSAVQVLHHKEQVALQESNNNSRSRANEPHD